MRFFVLEVVGHQQHFVIGVTELKASYSTFAFVILDANFPDDGTFWDTVFFVDVIVVALGLRMAIVAEEPIELEVALSNSYNVFFERD
jgi:hypothetical protein